MATADLLLHPVRMRIIKAFLAERDLTTADLRRRLPDVPPATLYRQVGTLAGADVLEVIGERKVRGVVERTYRLRLANATIGADEAQAMTADEHRQAFTAFVTSLLGDFDRYLQRPVRDPARDGVRYSQAAVYLTDRELSEVVSTVTAALGPFMARRPPRGAKRRLIATVVLPADDRTA